MYNIKYQLNQYKIYYTHKTIDIKNESIICIIYRKKYIYILCVCCILYI